MQRSVEGCLPFGQKPRQAGIDISDKVASQRAEIDAAASHHRGGIRVIRKRQQQMLQCRVAVPSLTGIFERAIQRS